MDFSIPEGATPLSQNDIKGLKVSATTREGLDAFEQANIFDARQWAFKNKAIKSDMLNAQTLCLLHKKNVFFCLELGWNISNS